MRKSLLSSIFRANAQPRPDGNHPAGGHPPASEALGRLLSETPGRLAAGQPYLLMTLGKGGTGKTTVAASLAVALAERGFSVVAASIDPAHNLGDVLDVKLGPDPQPVDAAGRLQALEVDTDRALERFLQRQADEVRGAYRYLQALNLDGYLQTLRYSPGVEEHATLEEMSRLLDLAQARCADVLIIDTPPTGLTLRVLSLPTISVRWADHLAAVRRALLERRFVLEQVLGPQHARVGEAELHLATREDNDPISQILKSYRQSMETLRRRLQDVHTCGVLAVKNPDRLSTFETARALDGLAAFGVPVAMMVVNKAAGGEEEPDVEAYPYPTRKIPAFSPEPIGFEAMRSLAPFLLEGAR